MHDPIDLRVAPSRPLPSRPLLVVGAGAAGMACALAAARHGAEVLLIERSKAVGGTVASSLIHTIGGLFDDAGVPVNPGLPLELIERLQQADARTVMRQIGKTRVLNVDPGLYRRVVSAWLAEEDRIHPKTDAEVVAVDLLDGRLDRVTLRIGETRTQVRPLALVDASGDAVVIRQIDPALVAPGEALAGLIAVVRQVVPGALAFPKGVVLARRIRNAVAEGELPQECATLWPDSGVAEDEVYLKFNLRADAFDPGYMTEVLQRLVDWLHPSPGFANAQIASLGRLGIRDGGRILGETTLTEADVKAGKRFADALCRGAWPIEHWHPEQGIRLEYLPPGSSYDIPLRALTVAGVEGVYAAGKCLSAEPRAQASARVAGTCWGMGAGLGTVLGKDAG